MQINFNLTPDTPEDFRILTAMMAALAGDTAPAAVLAHETQPLSITMPSPAAVLPEKNLAEYGTTTFYHPAPSPADTLIAAESARVAALPPPPPGAGGPLGVDAEGLPWDARIHSSNQKKTAKDVWVARRNVPDATVAQVRAELFAALGAPAPVPVGVAPPPPLPTAAPPPPAAVAQPAPPPPAAEPPAGGYTFSDMMMKVVDLQQEGRITPDDVTAKCVALGLAQIRDFAVRPDLIAPMMASLG